MKSLIFSRHETLQQEMERLTKLRESRPEDSEIRLRNGQLLLDLAKQGSVGDIRRVLECMDPVSCLSPSVHFTSVRTISRATCCSIILLKCLKLLY